MRPCFLQIESRWFLGWMLCLLLVGFPTSAQTDPLRETLERAQQLILEGDLDGAESELRGAVEEFARDPRPYNLLGVVEARRGESDNAESYFLRAIELAPGFAGAYLNLGRLYQEQITRNSQAVEKGIWVYRRLLDAYPDHAEANYQLAVLYHRQGDFVESQQYLSKLPPEDQTRPQALALACANHAGSGRHKEADAAARRLVAGGDLQEEDILPFLPILRSSGRDDLALQLLQSLAARQIVSVSTLEQLASLYVSAGNFGRARQVLEDLSARHPNLAELLLKLAWVAYRSGDYEGSLGYLSHARDLAPTDGRIHLFFGLTCVELNLGIEALNSLEKALSLQPDNPYYNYALGAAILLWREAREAIPYFEKYLQLKPGDLSGRAALAEAHFRDKDYDQARKQFQELVEFEETKARAHFYLGVIAKFQLRVEDALNHLEKSLEHLPDNPDALAELGWAYTRLGEFERAREALEKALELDSENYQANFNLLTLYTRTRDERISDQKVRFEEIKQKRWEKMTGSLRSIEVFPRLMWPGFFSEQPDSRP